MFPVELTFCDDLPKFLRRAWRGRGNTVRRTLGERTAIKDVIEACGIPHTEVDLIVDVTGHSDPVEASSTVDFSWLVEGRAALRVHASPAPAELLPLAPRLQVRRRTRFVADGHLGTLARNLRLLGLDTWYEHDADDLRLLEIMVNEERALLTRDRPLLMHSVVRHGYCPRSSEGEEQTREVFHRFGLGNETADLAPFTRCLRCNARLVPADKTEVLTTLAHEPLTLRYYEEFRRCEGCTRIYWPGTHAGKLAALASRLTAKS